MLRKYAFQSGADANSYLSDCIIFIKETGEPIYVEGIRDSGPNQIIDFRFISPKAHQVYKTIFLNEAFEVRKFPRLGYLTIEDGPQFRSYFLTRSALRSMKQGLHQTNVAVLAPPHSLVGMSLNNFYWDKNPYQALKNLFNSKFTDAKEAEEKALSCFSSSSGFFSKVDASQVEAPRYNTIAVARTLAISSDWKEKDKNNCVLLYKQNSVGKGNMKSGYVLDKEFSYLKEVLEEAGVKNG